MIETTNQSINHVNYSNCRIMIELREIMHFEACIILHIEYRIWRQLYIVHTSF